MARDAPIAHAISVDTSALRSVSLPDTSILAPMHSEPPATLTPEAPIPC